MINSKEGLYSPCAFVVKGKSRFILIEFYRIPSIYICILKI